MKRTFSSRPPTRTWIVSPSTSEVTTAVVRPFCDGAAAMGEGGPAPPPQESEHATAGSAANAAMTATNAVSRRVAGDGLLFTPGR